MKRIVLMLAVVMLLGGAGCATMPWSTKVDITDGINSREATIIGRDYIQQTQFLNEADTARGQVVKNQRTGCLTAHWLVTFPDKNTFWKNRYYYVIVSREGGKVLSGGVNWEEGEHWQAMLKGIDTCR